MRIVIAFVLGLLTASALSVAAQSWYPSQGPPWLVPTPQQRFQQQQHDRLLDAWFRQQLQQGLEQKEPCE